jgi:hypothetical protein
VRGVGSTAPRFIEEHDSKIGVSSALPDRGVSRPLHVVVDADDVPMEECPACGECWLDLETARRLDQLLTAMLASDAVIVTRHFDAPDQTAA